MGVKDGEIVDRLIKAAGYIRPQTLLSQKELEGYLGLKPKQLSERIRNADKNYLTSDVLLDLITTLHTYKEGSFQRKLMATVADIYEEMVFQTLPKEIRESMVQSMSRWNLLNFISNAAEIIWLPSSEASFQNELSQIFSPGKRHPMIALLVDVRHIPTAIDSIETWAYGPRGNYKDDLSLTVYTSHTESNVETVGCTIDDSFYGFVRHHDEGTFRLMSGIEVAQLRQQQLALPLEQIVWRLLRTADARKVERFVRNVTEDWYPEIIEFLRSIIINIENADRDNSSDEDDRDIFAKVQKELPEALGEYFGRKFSNRLLVYLSGLEPEYFT